jgi:hypothetical protein
VLAVEPLVLLRALWLAEKDPAVEVLARYPDEVGPRVDGGIRLRCPGAG